MDYKWFATYRPNDEDDLRRAYRDLCRQHHPDHRGGDEANMKEINEEYHSIKHMFKAGYVYSWEDYPVVPYGDSRGVSVTGKGVSAAPNAPAARSRGGIYLAIAAIITLIIVFSMEPALVGPLVVIVLIGTGIGIFITGTWLPDDK